MYFRVIWRIFQPKPPKIKKICPKNNCLYFGKWNFLTLRLKNFLYFLKKAPRIFQPKLKKIKKNPPRKKFLIFQEMELLRSNIKKNSGNGNPENNSLYFRKRKPWKSFLNSGKRNLSVHPQKISNISGNGNPPPKKFIFQEMETPKNSLYFQKRNFLIFRESYIQNPGIFKTRDIFRTLSNIYDEKVLQKIATKRTFQLQPSKRFPKKFAKKPALKKFLIFY